MLSLVILVSLCKKLFKTPRLILICFKVSASSLSWGGLGAVFARPCALVVISVLMLLSVTSGRFTLARFAR